MGELNSSTGSRPASAEDLRLQQSLREQMAQLSVPLLQNRSNSHEFLFYAFLDGTGQDLNNPKLGEPTTIGLAFKQVEQRANEPESRIGTHYSRGIGTQQNALGRALDGAFAYSWDDGIKEAYRALADQAQQWKQADPEAQIRLVSAGYSRGAVQVAGLARLVDAYGIANPASLEFGKDTNGNITVMSKLPALVAPGQAVQATLHLDPVATHMPANFDARLPPSVISRVSILAADERRELFPHQTINDPGITADRLAINVTAPGGHSNVGGGNKEPGMEILTGNAAFDYLNRLSDTPLFEKRPVPTDLSSITVYQAGGATAVFGLKLDNDGQRNLRDELANCKIVDPCRDSEPVDQKLASQFEYRSIPFDAVEQAQLQALVQQAMHRDMVRTEPPRPSLDSPQHPSHSSLLRIREGVQIAERSGQISFTSDTEREQFSRSALASMKDSRDISRVDTVVIGTKGYAFLVENGSNAHDQRRVPFDIEQAKHTPLAISDQILERAGQDANLRQDQQRHQGHARDANEPAMGGMAR